MLRNILNCEKKSADKNRRHGGSSTRRSHGGGETAPQCDAAKLVWKFDHASDSYDYNGCPAVYQISHKIPPNAMDQLFEDIKTIENYKLMAMQKEYQNAVFFWNCILCIPTLLLSPSFVACYFDSKYTKIVAKRKEDIDKIIQKFVATVLAPINPHLLLQCSPHQSYIILQDNTPVAYTGQQMMPMGGQQMMPIGGNQIMPIQGNF